MMTRVSICLCLSVYIRMYIHTQVMTRMFVCLFFNLSVCLSNSVTGIAVAAMKLLDTIAFFLQKRRNKAIMNSQTSWTAGHGTEKMGRICHRFEVHVLT